MLLLIQMSFILVFMLFAFAGVKIILIKLNMERNARSFKDQLIEPSGAAVSQGMVRTSPGKRGVSPDSQPSLTWYTRLFN